MRGADTIATKQSHQCGIMKVMKECSFVYILTNKWNTVLYLGVTGNLVKRVWEHKQKIVKGFTSRYNISKLVWYEIYQNIEEAIKREKQLKAGSRKQKNELINKMNPEWNDLYETIL